MFRLRYMPSEEGKERRKKNIEDYMRTCFISDWAR